VEENAVEQTVYLHYYTDTADYFISGYDGEGTCTARLALRYLTLQRDQLLYRRKIF